MEYYYSASKNKGILRFAGKWMELESIIPSKITQSQKNTHGMHSIALTNKWILIQKFRIAKIQFTDHMKLKKKEDQSVDSSDFLRRGNNILTGGDTETKYGAETEGKAIQKLPPMGIHIRYSHQTHTLL